MSPHDDQSRGSSGRITETDVSRSRPVTVTVIDYDESRLEERAYTLPGEFRLSVLHEGVTWIDVDGVHDTGVIQTVGDAVGIHPLTLEDIANTHQRPKIEDYGDYLYVAVRMLAPGDGEFHSEQVSLVLGRGYVVSFQEHPGDVFERIRERLRAGAGRLRSERADYLFYALLDAIVDGYFSVIEVFGERIEVVEEEVVAEPDRETLQAIYSLKRSLIALRRSVWPLREAVAQLERGESPLIGEPTLFYLRDVYDHVIEVAETVETYRDTMSGTLDVYLSSQSSRMNEIMKVLTVIATIFIPLTFIAGVYGMNFAYMPEISHPWGYPLALASMAAVAVAMLVYFRKKGWI
ncbi:magnesium/cobalt transporter CorA [Methanoculleus horonobensis]|jgi:magnesium transporter|uniref:magnesium/cobalt transporter CorA n=1 Tax=Methanoculleus horonobensis TaxID=528314 RepID=UPI00082C7CBE|nr:magnesium/cobalt transporter CorA [Methanoculleus horonobensis]MDD3069816.1 magnesium/cobalt transporter CorA [Methanoculleus horonobensis]MDD4252201.1 magnesium/cobalt transporter CorA [Methanoculleus horonobensis]